MRLLWVLSFVDVDEVSTPCVNVSVWSINNGIRVWVPNHGRDFDLLIGQDLLYRPGLYRYLDLTLVVLLSSFYKMS